MVTEQTKKRQKKKKTKQHNTLCAHHQLDKLTQQARNKQPSCTVLFAIPFVGCGATFNFRPATQPNPTPKSATEKAKTKKLSIGGKTRLHTHRKKDQANKRTANHNRFPFLFFLIFPHKTTRKTFPHKVTQSHRLLSVHLLACL